MKRIVINTISLALLVLATGCSPILPSSESESLVSSASSTEGQTSSSSSSSASSSTSNQSSSKADYKENELSTTSGLTIKFKAQGARIDSITWNNKQIAKDGFTVGRCANRIANGRFTLNGQTYNVTKNSGNNSLHGGGSSWQGTFATTNWTKVEQTASSIQYSFHSADGADGYPGNFDMTVTYTLSQEGELSIEYRATSDKDTLCNPTNHLFMSLNGPGSNGRLSDANHKLWINADNYTPLNSNQLPTGQIAPVAGTQFDYTTEKAFDNTKSYDDNYVLNGTDYRKVATMTGSTLGVKVDVFTDRAGLQLYRDGQGSICLETQMFPDMINQPTFADYGTTVLKANEQFYSKTTYAFSAV